MEKNPADEVKSTMWSFLMTKGQEANVLALKDAVYDLIKMTTQKTAGQRAVKKDIDWSEAGMTMMSIVIEATALVLSGELDGEAEWIPVGERLPEFGEYVMISFSNFSLPIIGRCDRDEEGIMWFAGDELESLASQNLFVNAWQPLPEPYEEGADEY